MGATQEDQRPRVPDRTAGPRLAHAARLPALASARVTGGRCCALASLDTPTPSTACLGTAPHACVKMNPRILIGPESQKQYRRSDPRQHARTLVTNANATHRPAGGRQSRKEREPCRGLHIMRSDMAQTRCETPKQTSNAARKNNAGETRIRQWRSCAASAQRGASADGPRPTPKPPGRTSKQSTSEAWRDIH